MQNIKHVGMSLFDLGWNLGAWWDAIGPTGRAIVAVAVILAAIKAIVKLDRWLRRRARSVSKSEFREFYMDLHAATGDMFSQGEAHNLCQRLLDNPELSEQVRIPMLAGAEERGEG